MRNSVIKILQRIGFLRSSYRIYEFLKLIDPGFMIGNIRYWNKVAPDGMPLPPPKLVVLVAGHSSLQPFIKGGRLAVQSIVDTLAMNGVDINKFQAILDFGCGCGRAIRHWHGLPHTAVFGTDYNPELIKWCKDHLPFAQFDTNRLAPPLCYPNDSFDLIYSLSVFTHLPESLQHEWLEELGRVLKPGGYLFITLHGEHYLGMLTQDERIDFEAGRLVVRYQEVAGTNMCSTFHSEKYVRDKLAHDFEVVSFIPEGAKGNLYQDVYLLKKPSA